MAFVKVINNSKEWARVNLLVVNRLEVNPAPFEITIDDPKRSNKQNALIHALFDQCARVTGKKDGNYWKELAKLEIGLKTVFFDLDDQPHILIVSTSKYTKPQMVAFVDKLQAWMKTDHKVDIEIKEIQDYLKEKPND